MKSQPSHSDLGAPLVSAVVRALRQLGTLGAIAVLSAAPFVALCAATFAQGAYRRLCARTERAVQAALRAETGLRELRSERWRESPVTHRCAEIQRAPEPECPQSVQDLGIEQIARGSYSVPLRAMHCLLDQRTTAHSLRLVPEARGGRVLGVRLLRVAPRGALGLLGFRTGDLMTTVNRHDISSPDNALEAYANARRTGQVVVRVIRDGRPRELRYYITSPVL